ncbi:hypothetical protein GXM_06051 [Nostoc sphaeroides CCNUC1]|uniref:Uncharacterized protein n=1 Tax=Nostoc sphaeroides CCNUC1 TaxID=2653204 RepID=A0A5P8W725_9NOSO|nr:hypothetical protein GXM_06051 [Nostoc sphaeroides CCNUC1]
MNRVSTNGLFVAFFFQIGITFYLVNARLINSALIPTTPLKKGSKTPQSPPF